MKVATRLAKADLSSWLGSLQSWQLKQLAFLTGLQSTGTKVEIGTTLSNSLNELQPSSTGTRILSVDMGVKNLAFCLLDTHKNSWKSNSEPNTDLKQTWTALHLLEWKRLDVSGRLLQTHKERLGQATIPRQRDVTTITQPGDETTDKAYTPAKKHANLYSPASLSKVAYSLAAEFVKYQPDKILIERQRFRSGGAPAIQEWTVRVNMLESMIWAALETLRHKHTESVVKRDKDFPEVLEMSPRRIGSFWLAHEKEKPVTPANISAVLEKRAQSPASGDSKVTARAFEKKDKIALARYWLRQDSGDLGYGSKLASQVSSFLSPKSTTALSKSPVKRTRRKKSSNEETELLSEAENIAMNHASATVEESQEITEALTKLGKLDDLADCLVQGVTHVLWEENRRRILQHVSTT